MCLTENGLIVLVALCNKSAEAALLTDAAAQKSCFKCFLQTEKAAW